MASRRAARRKACFGKRRYDSAARAARAARLLTSRARAMLGVGWVTWYRCPYCGAFHVGHPPKRVRQSLRDRSLVLHA